MVSFIIPGPRRAPGAGLRTKPPASRFHRLGCLDPFGKAPLVPFDPAPPPPSWSQASPDPPYLQALRGRLPHLSAARGFGGGAANQILDHTVRGAGETCSRFTSGGLRPGAGRRRVSAKGCKREEAARCHRQLVGTAARRLSWRSCERTTQLRPGPESARRRPLPPPPPSPPPGPARSEPARRGRPKRPPEPWGLRGSRGLQPRLPPPPAREKTWVPERAGAQRKHPPPNKHTQDSWV